MRIFLICVAFSLACATAEPVVPPRPTQLQAVPARQPPPFDARAFAADQLTPAECETSARQLRPNADQAWDATTGTAHSAMARLAAWDPLA